VAHEKDDPILPLRRRLGDEEVAYANALAAVDRLAALLPTEPAPETARADLTEINVLWAAPHPPQGGGLAAAFWRRVWGALSPLVGRQERFNAALVRVLNGHLDRTDRLSACLSELAGALVRYAQRVEPLIALHDRIEVLSEQVRALRGSLEAGAPAPEVARLATRAAVDSVYTAFENRFRGSREEIRVRQADYAALFLDCAPVVDLGCGRGEFLDLLRAQGTEARGVEGNANVVRECREKGLDVVQGDLLAFLRGQGTGSLGGIFAAQVVEHLPPPVLTALLSDAHRALRPGGLLALETVNPASALAFLEFFIRDPTHERPLHPETLRFLAAAAGFGDARIEMRSPVPDEARLRPVPSPGLPLPTIEVLNENVGRLNTLLFAPLDYVLIARR
jgi:SAM-dependent methyltransferase